MNNVTKYIKERKLAIGTAISAIAGRLISFTAYAGSIQVNPEVISKSGTGLQDIIGQFLGVISTVALVIGIILGAWGVFELVMSSLRDDPDSKSKGAKVVAIAAILVCLKFILPGIANTLWSTGTAG